MQKLQLSIPEPCHQNWEHMTPTQQGRFCNACAKEVVDFSMMTDTEILNYFTTFSNEKVCGRALPGQLERTISRPVEPKKRLFWYWNYIVMFFMLFSKNSLAKKHGGILLKTELSPAKPAGMQIFSSHVMGDTEITGNRLVTGKITDRDGNPVSFAAVKIKGTAYGISADANGQYSINVKPGDILVISAAFFKAAEIPVGFHSALSTVLERNNPTGLLKVGVAYTGVNRYCSLDEEVNYPRQKYRAVIHVKDDASGLPVTKAKLVVIKEPADHSETAFTDSKGNYKLKGLDVGEDYFVKVEADGYGVNEFTINPADFKDNRKVWDIWLKKIETAPSNENSIRLGKMNMLSVAKGPVYVVDGVITPDGNKIDPVDIENITVLQGSEVSALFGIDASVGAIVITTRKAKVKKLDTVAVYSDISSRRRLGAMTRCVRISGYAEVKAHIKTVLSDSLKIFPNPVQRGNSFTLSLKLKQAGHYQVQIADAAGRIILQKQVDAVVREYTEVLPADNKWSAGVYYIRVFDNKNQLISKSSFIVR